MESSAAKKSVRMTPEAIESKIKEIESNPELPADVKAKTLEVLRQSMDELNAANRWTTRRDAFQQQSQEAPRKLEEARRELEQPLENADPALPDNATVAQLEQALVGAETKLGDAKKQLSELDREPQRRADRRKDIPGLQAANEKKIEQIQADMQSVEKTQEASELISARRLLLRVRRKCLRDQIDSMRAENLSYDARSDLLTVERDLARRNASSIERAVRTLQDRINERRKLEAIEQARQARREAMNAHPLVKQIADEAAKLAEMRIGSEGMASKIEAVAKRRREVSRELQRIESTKKQIGQRIQAAGMNNTVGILLRKERKVLPDVAQLRSEQKQTHAGITEAQLSLIEFENERIELAEIDLLADTLARTIDPEGIEDEHLRTVVMKLLQTKRECLDALINDANAYFAELVELEAGETELITVTEDYRRFIDEHVLWIESLKPMHYHDFLAAKAPMAWFVDPAKWKAALLDLWTDMRAHPLLAGCMVLCIAVLAIFKRRLREQLREMGEKAKRSCTDKFAPTVKALGLTVAIAAIWPATMLLVAWRLDELPGTASDFTSAVAFALRTTAVLYLMMEVLRAICRTKGLADAHFGWSGSATRRVRKTLWWVIVLGLPAVFFVSITEWRPEDILDENLGRIATICGLLVLAVALHLTLRPKRGIFQEQYALKETAWIRPAIWTIWGLGLAIPTTLAALAVVGYYYTALQLTVRLQATFWVMLGLLLVNALLLRWLLIARRKLAFRRLREQRAAQQAQQEVAQESTSAGIPNTAALDEPLVSLSAVNQQTRRLLTSITAVSMVLLLWLVWVDVLPAVRVIGRTELWSTVETVTESIPGPDGTAEIHSTDKVIPTTLGDVIRATLVLLVTFAASRNLPGLLELTVLQRLPLDNGGRYATTTVCRYVITAVGLAVAFELMGFGWSKVQWLIAAISVGLGFGLQEIFANFVSGLILLFERPVRVGDIVSVGDVSGTVAKIRMRATTIVNWDAKELVLPNRDFITGSFVNWTLSNRRIRIVIPIGIAYGSDTQLANDLLVKIAEEHPSVIDDPAPSVVFDGFGESSLNFILRAFVNNVDDNIPTRHALNMRIDKEFRDAGIEISFAQRDLHLRSIDPELAKVFMGQLGASSKSQDAVVTPDTTFDAATSTAAANVDSPRQGHRKIA